jgi:hypothetical protein
MRKIGITFDPPINAVSMFSNGIRQNALYFMETLQLIGYDVLLIVEDSKVEKMTNLYGIKELKWIKLSEIFDNNFDVIFQFSAEVHVTYIERIKELKKHKNIKLISYNCGNEYLLDMENALFGKNSQNYRSAWENTTQFSKLKELHPVFDQIWSIPQMSYQNLKYWKTLYRCDSIEVPFIWSPVATEQYQRDSIQLGLPDLMYKKRDTKKISIFEPNINSMKWFFPALLVCENAYRMNSDSIDHVFLTNINGNSRINIDFVNEIVKPLDIYKDKKISIESRYNSLYFMSTHSDISVSFQHENPLNYLYLDLAWYGWPIIHNAHLCKDIGYYYPDFDFEIGGKVLLDVVNNHHHNWESYLKTNRELISRYLPTNLEVQSRYKHLIECLFD